jgi:hypothetical protein
MDANTPMVLATARYATRDQAVAAFKTVWGARHQGEFDHTAIAVLTKDQHGQLQVERHDSTAKHFGWGGAILGAALCVIAPPVGVATLAATTGGTAAVGGLVGHFWHTIPKDKVAELGDLLESGESGLLIVAVNHKGDDITPLLLDAEKKVVVDTTAGDLDAAFDKSFQTTAPSGT